MATFAELGLNEQLLSAVSELGFINPTPVQEMVIPRLLEDPTLDLVALAQTGTGKTAAFGLPLLQLTDLTQSRPEALIMCPTRELCLQVSRDIENYAKNIGRIRVVAVYGGASIVTQIKDLRAGAQVVVATPGRLMDLMNRGAINCEGIKRVVMDEADEMLNMGFQEDMEHILAQLPNKETVWLFSATMPEEIRQISRKYMKNVLELKAGIANQSAANIEHVYYTCRPDQKYEVLKRVVDYYPEIFGIIFCRTRAETQEIAEQLIRDGYNAAPLHGDMGQNDRDRCMNRFRERNLQILVATDVAARGIDVNDITHVIHYSLPTDSEVYTHRSGRTARAGKSGISISLIIRKDVAKIGFFEKKIKATFAAKNIPTGPEVCQKQLINIVQVLHSTEVMADQLEPFLPQIYEELKDLDREEIIKRFASIEFNRFLKYYQKAVDLNTGGPGAKPATYKDRPMGTAEAGFTRLFINVGMMDGATKPEFIKLVSMESDIPAKSVGRVDLARTFSHFEVESKYADRVISAMGKITISGRRLRINNADEGGQGGGGGFERNHEAKFSGGGDRGGRKYSGGGSDRGGDRGGSKFGGGGRDSKPSRRY